MPITTNQIVKDRSSVGHAMRAVARPAYLSLDCLNGQGPGSLLIRTWPLATLYGDGNPPPPKRLIHGEGGNYTGVAKPCKGAAEDS